MPEIVSKLLRCAVWSGYAVRLESTCTRNSASPQQKPLLLGQIVCLDLLLCTGFDSEHADLLNFCSDALHYCLWATDEWSQNWAKRWALLWLVTSSREIHRNSISHGKKSVVTAQNIQSNETFLTLKVSQYCKSGSTFSQASRSRPASTAADSEFESETP